MRWNTVLVSSLGFKYTKNNIDYSDIVNSKKDNCKIVMLNSDLFIKIIKLNEKYKNVEKLISLEINKFFKGDNLLFHYLIIKNKREKMAFIYTIKNNLIIDKLEQNTGNIKIIPVQFLFLKKILKDINKELNFIIFTLNEYTYVMGVWTKVIVSNHIINNKEVDSFKNIFEEVINGVRKLIERDFEDYKIFIVSDVLPIFIDGVPKDKEIVMLKREDYNVL
ncbi:hypothetical protein CPJCM30710_06260 [Clostridium polyendosporum]|uniref:Uncharacterized protein n=1 Tax=Clostridium polyendosporum TaxID=69208 RepID=A0A919VF16_9CLOT|nr:hypothetical protein [Clostridium polyendosporum]GIM27960.1 hypothetical protein CPJCM30710_06260 [Clostridium polyendosporum]